MGGETLNLLARYDAGMVLEIEQEPLPDNYDAKVVDEVIAVNVARAKAAAMVLGARLRPGSIPLDASLGTL